MNDGWMFLAAAAVMIYLLKAPSKVPNEPDNGQDPAVGPK
jgi:hypothetical protein